MTAQAVRARLEALAEPGYRAFSLKLLPGVENRLGVRIPTLRRIARQICQADWRTFLCDAQQEPLFEMVMLSGMVIAHAPCRLEERLALLSHFVGRIDNWSVCDTIAGDLKCFRTEPEAGLAFLLPLLSDPRPFAQRFALVMLLLHYLDAAHIALILQQCALIRSEHFYVRMAVAWTLSMAYVAFPEETLPLLAENVLDAATHRLTLQKLRESQQLSPEEKRKLMAYKC